MTISASRTVAFGQCPTVYGVQLVTQRLAWPQAQPADNLDYTLDMAAALTDASDAIASASFAISPSGAGELQVSALSIEDTLVTAQLSGGVPGRSYLTCFKVVSQAARTFEVLVWLSICDDLATGPLLPPASLGFGTTVTATAT